ncbi:glycosyltransferase [Arundinibacter roseus]|uniref:Glycosyltransferase n=1 Tax=Arundinibacter roseus TaxID=2070510 RepID=A0A4R4JZS0_9BACT|nr:glycosyltransferase [Arundinibacter roseus]TDB60444.1 glycosyltransferase [Arundinibacter roseus]
MKNRIKILFFTPYATRTGSEMMLLYILKNLDRTRFDAGLVSFAQGELLDNIPADIPIFIGPGHYSLAQKVAFHLGFHPMERFLETVNRKFKADVWYVNTVMLADVIKGAKKMQVPVITHIHELSHMLSFVSRTDYERIITQSDMLIGCSEAVCKNLRDAGGKEVKKLLSFIDLNTIHSKPERVTALRKEWGVQPGDFVWIMSGTTSERKGFDLLPDLAEIINDPTVHLVWVGRASPDGMVYLTEKRCQGIQNTRVHLVGAQKGDYFSYLAAADGFMLTSRQEPLGLVMVEAAWLGKPIVAFDSGGPTEFIEPGIGTIIPNLDMEQFVQALDFWRKNPGTFDSERAKNRAKEFGSSTGMAAWETIVDDFCKQN